MRWWPIGHESYGEWRVNGRRSGLPKGIDDIECCQAMCPICGVALYSVVQFQGPCRMVVEEVGLETAWPEDDWK